MQNDFIERIRAFDHYLKQLDPASLDTAEREALRALYRDLTEVLQTARRPPSQGAQS